MKDTSELRQFLTKMDLDPGYISKFLKDQAVRNFIIENNLKDILDIGCDTCYIAGLLNHTLYRFNYTGIDYRNSALKENLTKYQKFVQSENIFQTLTSIKDSSRDCVLLLDVIEHMESPEQGLELLRIASSKVEVGKYIIVSTPNRKNSTLNWPKYHKYEYSIQEVRAFTRTINLIEIALHGWSMSDEIYLDIHETVGNRGDFELLPISIKRALLAWDSPNFSRDVLFIFKRT